MDGCCSPGLYYASLNSSDRPRSRRIPCFRKISRGTTTIPGVLQIEDGLETSLAILGFLAAEQLGFLFGMCKWLNPSSPLPPSQEAEEYETKLKEVQEEQATYRKALELELKKLRTEVIGYV